MPDIKLTLPGPETITMAGNTVDKLLRAGDGDAALLYLYILKTHGQSTSAEAASALGKGSGAISSAMAVLSRLGLIQCDQMGTEPQDPVPEPRDYSISEIKRELESGSAFSFLVEEAQRSLGKILSPDDLLRLFGIYEALRLPTEVIMILITHCITECRRSGSNRSPSMRYIEKAAYTWEREGIFTLDRAEEYIKLLDSRRSILGEIKKVLNIKDRELSATEKKYVDRWLEMGFDSEAVDIAYDRTLLKTGKLAWSYMDSIMKSWHSKGLHTREEILEKDTRSSGRKAAQHSGKGKHAAPNLEDIERMQKLLQKIKEE